MGVPTKRSKPKTHGPFYILDRHTGTHYECFNVVKSLLFMWAEFLNEKEYVAVSPVYSNNSQN